jgi:thiamine monophosphate kinase
MINQEGRTSMKRYLVVLLAAGAALFARPALAHHSFSATYLETESVTIEGEIVQFVFRNPHSFVHVNVKEKDGTVTTYNVGWGGTGQLNNTGVTRETLKAGDVVVITGAPGRNAADHRIRMVTLKRPKDGFTWGGTPGQTVD